MLIGYLLCSQPGGNYSFTLFFKKSFLLSDFYFFLPDFSAFQKGCLELCNLQYRSLENIALRLL